MKEKVLEHYENIANDFDNLSNKYCNERYQNEISKYIRFENTILDIGCGTGRLLSKLNVKKRVGVDMSLKLLKQLKDTNMRLVLSDAECLSLKKEVFDLVYSVNLLEHVPYPDRVLDEGLRVLKRGGKFVMITPNGDMGLFLEIAERLGMKAPEGPHRFLPSKKIKSIIPKNNVKILKYSKIVLFPKGPRFILDILERIEPIIALGFFHLVVLEKI